MKKKISLAAVFTALFLVVFAGSAFAAFSDVAQDHKYYEAITTLSKLESAGPIGEGESKTILNGYEDGTFKPDSTITRAEFTKIAVYTLGLQGIKLEPTEFTDVSSHWAKYSIKAAYDSKIINGMGDGTFAPDENVTYDQALKIVVCMLNRGDQAELEGGYPEGYRSIAAKLKLTEGVQDLKYDSAATRGVIAQIMYNALEVEMSTSTSDNEVTLLKDYLKVKKLKGILVGVENYVTGDCSQTLNLKELDILGSKNEGEVIINYQNFKNASGAAASVTDINKYLGKTITVYYQQARDIDTPMLMIIDDESTNNKEYEIRYTNILSFKNNNLEYYEGENSSNSKKLRFSENDINIRYNGKVVRSGQTYSVSKQRVDENGVIQTLTDEFSFDEALKNWLDPDSDFFIYGDIKLTDRDSDGDINDVQINDYNVMVVYRKPVTSDYRVTDKLITGNNITLDPDSGDYTYTIVKNGSQIDVTSLNANDVLLYAKSLDGEMYTCEVSNESVKGKVTSINDQDNEIYIDNTMYKIGSMCRKYISTNQDGKTLSTGQTGTFYIDKFNTVVYGVIEDETTKPYAYVTNAYASEDNSSYYLSAFIPSKSTSGAVNYKLKDKVTLNGKKVSDTDVISYLSELAENPIGDSTNYYNNNDINNASKQSAIYGTTKTNLTNASQPVRMELNSANEIISIVTVTDDENAYNEDGTTAITTNEDTTRIVRCKDLTQYNYTSSSFTLSNKSQFQINSSTAIIYVPGDRTDKSEYTKKATSSFTSTMKYYVEAYDINSSKVAGLVILYGKTGSDTEVTKLTDYSIVAEQPQSVYDEDNGEDRLSFSVYAGTSSTPRQWTAADSDEFADVEPGDVILFGYDQDRYAQGRQDIIRYSDISEILDGKLVDVADKTSISEDDEDGEGSVESETTHQEMYNWTEEPDGDTVQTQKFNYRYPKSNSKTSPFYETYTSATLGTIPYSRACMYNVYQIQEESNKLFVTQGGFAVNSSGDAENVLYDTDNYEEITISSGTRIIRMDRDGRVKFSPNAEGTETAMTYRDLKAAQNYGSECSKVLVCSRAGSIRLIVVFE
ncbi:MAG: S-layer homology domain-containing protein [bacterium]|nr:S-layer homology domain-containing protein [bacterium]